MAVIIPTWSRQLYFTSKTKRINDRSASAKSLSFQPEV